MSRAASGGLFGALARGTRRAARNARHRKRWPIGTILHSEWDRRLGVCTLLAIGLAMTLALTYYVVMPRVFAEALRAGGGDGDAAPPPPLIGFAVAALLIGLSAHQLSWIARRLPRGCALYNFAYAGYSQAAAFLVAWSQLFDAILLAAILAQAYGEHFRLLFATDGAPPAAAVAPSVGRVIRFARPSAGAAAVRRLAKLDPPASGGFGSDLTPISAPSPSGVDWLALAAIGVVALCLMCSLRVLLTATIVFLVAALFTSASTTIVALLHNLPLARINRLADDLPLLVEQTAANVPHFLVGFLAVELLSQLGDECAEPRTAVPLTTRQTTRGASAITAMALLSFFPFVYRIHNGADNPPPVPVFFNAIGIHSAKYLMNLDALCALSAALLCSFLPLSRLLSALGADALLPAGGALRRLYGRSGAPRVAVALSAVVVAALTATGASTTHLAALMSLNLCGRLCAMAVIVYLSAFRAESYLSNDDDDEGTAPPLAYERLCHRRRHSVCVWEERRRHRRCAKTHKKRANFLDVENSFSLDNGHSSDSLSASSSSSTAASGSSDSDSETAVDETHLLERIWRLANCENGDSTAGEQRGLLEKCVPATVRLSVTTDGQTPRLAHVHNCLRSPCGSSYALSAAPPELASVISIRSGSFHIYEATANAGGGSSTPPLRIVAFTRHGNSAARRLGRAGVRGAEERERSARRALAVFAVAAAIFALGQHIIRGTAGYVPLLAIIACAAGALALAAASFHTYCIGADADEERAFSIGAPSVSGCRSAPAYGSFTSISATPVTTVVALADDGGDRNGQSVGWLAGSCLTTLAVIPQLFGQFGWWTYIQLAAYYLAGALLYLTRICRKQKRKVRL